MFKNINISSLYGPENKERKSTDKAIFKAANEIGFLKISGLQNFQSMKGARKFFYQFLNCLKKVRKIMSMALRIPTKMFTEAGFHYKMVCQLTNKELILVLTLFSNS